MSFTDDRTTQLGRVLAPSISATGRNAIDHGVVME
jgi:hypothetical protein